METNKAVAMAVITGGGALAGLIGGWNCGPLNPQVGPDQLAFLGATGGSLLSLCGCHMAMEYAEARARNEKYVRFIRRLGATIISEQRRRAAACRRR